MLISAWLAGPAVFKLTITGWITATPHSISLTSPDVDSIESVAIITGVGSSHEGGSRGCVHCSIGGVGEGTTVNSYRRSNNVPCYYSVLRASTLRVLITSQKEKPIL